MSTENSPLPDAERDTAAAAKRAAAPQTMKPATAAKKLGVHLPATPESFRSEAVTRDQFTALVADPPAWLVELRRNGPHPRPEVARRLGVTISGLARGGVDEPLTSDAIRALLAEMPAWLAQERHNLAQVREEEARVRARNAERASKADSAER